jgi:two-component system, LuxR family, response regulator FixJ
MKNALAHVSVVDPDLARRGKVCRLLFDGGIHVEPFESVPELVAFARRKRTSLILVADTGREVDRLFKHMADWGEWVPAIAYAQTFTPRQVVQVTTMGAVGFLAWPFELPQLLEIVDEDLEDAIALRDLVRRRYLAQAQLKHLSRRQREIIEGVADGLTSRQIAEKLSISHRTVEIHRKAVTDKLGMTSSEVIRLLAYAE